MDALASWFTLHLDTNTSFSTAPSHDTSWEQAIFPPQSISHLQVSEKQSLEVEASCTDSLLKLTTGQVLRKCPPVPSHYIERSDLARLNDEVYVTTVVKALSSYSSPGQFIVLDLTNLPLISLLAGADINYMLLGNFQSYYEVLIGEIIQLNGLQEKVSLTPLTAAIASHVTWDAIVCDVVTPQGTLDTPCLQLLKLMR